MIHLFKKNKHAIFRTKIIQDLNFTQNVTSQGFARNEVFYMFYTFLRFWDFAEQLDKFSFLKGYMYRLS